MPKTLVGSLEITAKSVLTGVVHPFNILGNNTTRAVLLGLRRHHPHARRWRRIIHGVLNLLHIPRTMGLGNSLRLRPHPRDGKEYAGGLSAERRLATEMNIVVGTHADSLIAEAILECITVFDHELAWEAVRKDASCLQNSGENCGQISAWYLFSAMGFYPINPVFGEYLVGSPFFEEISIALQGTTKNLHINAPGAQTKPYLKSPTINGEKVHGPTTHHGQIAHGAEVVFEMSDHVERWGNDAAVLEGLCVVLDELAGAKEIFEV